ncbi:MAG: hypothetical protein C0614_10725 [Desulfuromonas sp.]|nr:MAG: hypothetical protein C0614_10725 [Desulfuromonas sp.]
MLRSLGLKTSIPLAKATPLNPFNPYRSLLYCRYIERATPLNQFLIENPVFPERSALLEAVARQVSKMIRSGVVFRDFYFGNILYAETGELFWVDTEIKRYPFRKARARKRFLQREKFLYERFLRHGGKHEEWGSFQRIMLGGG